MVKYIVIIMVLWLILSIGFSYMTYLIGYTKGFNKCKRIDDETLDKYSKEREWVWQDLYQSNQMDYIVDFRVSRIVLQHGIWREKIISIWKCRKQKRMQRMCWIIIWNHLIWWLTCIIQTIWQKRNLISSLKRLDMIRNLN